MSSELEKLEKCIQTAKEIINEEPITEYHPPFLNGLELDAFFQKHQIGLEVQGAHSIKISKHH
ncbi:19653_t:CDS:2 [Rhizophagus irregularis]|nr:19653_t:CDS:2 [Rhizophagus irregularis]